MTPCVNVFGPVPSRRLGISLGVDLIPYKTCSYDCIYCELGRTAKKTMAREEYVSRKLVMEQLEDYLAASDISLDYITLSGSGEPTLNSEIGWVIRGIKKLTSVPVAVLTNGSLLFMEQVREDLLDADVVLPSLDAVSPFVFKYINRPHSKLQIEKIIEGLVDFRKEFKGQIWLEVLFCRAVNDDKHEIKKMVEMIEKINPDKVQLNTAVRPPVEGFAFALSEEQLQDIKEMMGERAEIIPDFDKVTNKAFHPNIEDEIVNLIRRRPCTTDDISRSLGIHLNEAVKYINKLVKDKRIRYKSYGHKDYYQVKNVSVTV